MVPENKHLNTDYDQMRSEFKMYLSLVCHDETLQQFPVSHIAGALTLTLSNEVTVVIVASCIDTGGRPPADTRHQAAAALLGISTKYEFALITIEL